MKTPIKTTAFYVLLFMLIIANISCEQEIITNPQNETLSDTIMINELAYPGKSGEKTTITIANQTLEVEKIEGKYVLGDMLFSNGFSKSTGIIGKRWPNNTVPYSIYPNLAKKDRVFDAIAHWEAKTPLKFVERDNQKDYVYFTDGIGCSSYVGRQGGQQIVSIEPYCSLGSTIHEIGHAIGLWHEQMRKDRDQFITVNFDNMHPSSWPNFQTYEERGDTGEEHTETLDFNSIMMYDSFSFSTNKLPVMVKKDGSTFSAQRDGLSQGDIQGVKIMYSDGGNEDENDICKDVAPYQQGISYQTGYQVTYFGNLYQRTATGWRWIGRCAS